MHEQTPGRRPQRNIPIPLAPRSRRDSRDNIGVPGVLPSIRIVRYAHLLHVHLLGKKIMMALPKIIDEIHEQFGDNVSIDSDYFRPSLWRLYESHFPGTVRSVTLAIPIGQPFGQAK